MRTVRQVLTEARGLIARGWCKRQFNQTTDCGVEFCALGAIMYTAGETMYLALVRDKTYYDARTALCQVIDGQSITSWNDAPERTKEEVLAAFDMAIAQQQE